MPDKKSKIFRQQALERLSSPEQLDLLMQIVSPKDWLPLGGFTLLGVMAILWSIFGSIPIAVTAKGVLINPRRVLQFQSPISGQLQSLKIRDGQCVKKDDILAIIDPSATKQQLQQQRDKLAQLKLQIGNATLVREQATQQELKSITAERTSLHDRLRYTERLTPRLKDKELNSIFQQRRSLQQQLKDAEELTPLMEQRLAKQRNLQEQGGISQEQVLQAEQEYRRTRQNISEIQAQLEQLEVQETELQQKYLDNLNSIAQLKAELEKLDLSEKQLEKNNLEASNAEQNQIQEVQQAIALLEKEVADNSIIKSPHTGCIVEIPVTVGQYVNPGVRLGTLEIAESSSDLLSVNYFDVADGKKIQPGMKVLITPDTVKRTRYGGIVGEITEVSPFAVTSETATSVVGNPEVVQKIIGPEGGKVEVIAQLIRDSNTFSGYKWSSSDGPELEISPGTTTTVRVIVEERSPITFVLPILREWSGSDS